MRPKKIQKPTPAQMAGMLTYIGLAHEQQAETEKKGCTGRTFTIYEVKLEGWVRDLVREVKRLRKRRGK